MIRIAVDPGDEHVGVAVFIDDVCHEAREMRPQEFLHWFDREMSKLMIMGPPHEVVVEEFRLYPWRMQQQGFSLMRTAEMIGIIKWLARGHDIVFQKASIKKPVMAQVRQREYKMKSWGQGPHAKDAECHGLYRIWKLEDDEVQEQVRREGTEIATRIERQAAKLPAKRVRTGDRVKNKRAVAMMEEGDE